MGKKKIYIVLGTIVSLFVIILIVLQLNSKKLVEDFLSKKIPSHLVLGYDAMEVNILQGSIHIKNLSLTLLNRDTTLAHSHLNAEHFLIDDLSYSQFFFHNTIQAKKIILDRPIVKYYPHLRIPKKDTVQQGVVKLLKAIHIKEINLGEGEFFLIGQAEDSIQLQAKNIDLKVRDARTGPKLVNKKIPLSYDGYDFSATDIFVDIGPYEKLNVEALTIHDGQIAVDSLLLQSKYGKEKLSGILKKERDHVSLKIPKLKIRDIDFGFDKDRFFVATGSCEIHHPNLEMYRDKLLPDDTDPKRMYGRMLRELPINIYIPEIRIKDGHIGYEEKIDPRAKAGRLFFDGLNAIITEINNEEKVKKKTNLNIEAKLMGNAPLELDWSFDSDNESDAFTISGSLKGFNAKSANSFLRPSLRVEAEGAVDQLYFTISGNAIRSSGDMKMKYRDFKFEVLDRDLLKVNKLLSAIGNLFINDGSKTDAQGFRYGKIEAERNRDKSFFNYLWINVRNGIGSTITGDGKKKRK